MTELVAILSTGKGTWAEVAKIITGQEWERILIITNEFGSQTFNKKENMEILVINPESSLELITEAIHSGLKDKISGFEVAVNFISGSGKEHMALVSALIKLGIGFRLVGISEEGIKEY